MVWGHRNGGQLAPQVDLVQSLVLLLLVPDEVAISGQLRCFRVSACGQTGTTSGRRIVANYRTTAVRPVGGLGALPVPAYKYAPATHAPVEGRGFGVLVLPKVVSLQSAEPAAPQELVRLFPAPTVASLPEVGA